MIYPMGMALVSPRGLLFCSLFVSRQTRRVFQLNLISDVVGSIYIVVYIRYAIRFSRGKQPRRLVQVPHGNCSALKGNGKCLWPAIYANIISDIE